tara:strand:- start:42575 stop:42934 length:360 start_codon:yes stop_codon:yes gene_type:complete
MKYITLFIILLIIEIAIAYFHFHPFIRYFIGDVLVVPLLYCLLKFFISISSEKIALYVLLFAFFVEMLQYFSITEVLEIRSSVLRIIIGTTFSIWDLVAYTIGYITIIISVKFFPIKKR